MKKVSIFLVTSLCLVFSAQAQKLIAFKNVKQLWGFKDKEGNIVVQPKYYIKPTTFVDGRAVFMKSYTQQGILDENGKELTAPIYSNIGDFKDGFAIAIKEIIDSVHLVYGNPSKYMLRGVIDRNGKEIIPVKYKYVSGNFNNGWFVRAENNTKEKVFYNKSGQIITVPEGLQLTDDRIDGKKFVAMKNGKYGIVDMKFKELLPFEYSGIIPTEDELLIVGQNNLYGLMNNKFKWVVKPTYANIQSFQKGYAVIINEEKLYGAINANGVITTQQQFNAIYRIDNSTIALYKNEAHSNMSGLLDLATGKVITPAEYIFNVYNYYQGRITFMSDNKKGLMDTTGKQLFLGDYDEFSPGFNDDRAWVQKQNKYGFIDGTGKLVIPVQYDMAGGFVEGLAKVKLNGKYGYIDLNGILVIPMIYNDAQNFESGMAWVKDETNRAYYIDKTGKELK